ncbi:hypothetical protein LUZ60_005540 [Juncus effusus]|nr:hypothetical protein LUZ60_005540 [Juncus effusus]
MQTESVFCNHKLQTETLRVKGSVENSSLSLLHEHGGPAGQLRWRSEDHVNGGEGRILDLDRDVLGFETKDKTLLVKAFVVSQQNEASCFGVRERTRVRKDFAFEMDTEEMAAQWARIISDNITLLGRPKQLFVIVNPFGGKRSAPKIFDTEVKPLLEAANIHFTMKESKYMLHAKELASKLDLTKCDGIVCVSGDGVLVEVVNGLLQREDWEKAIKLPLGVIPAGTGNGMAKSLLHSVGDLYSPSNATFAIIRGHKRSLDVASVVQGSKKFFSVLLLTWGLVADIDIESEKYRWMGSVRFDFYSVLRILDLRKYNGKIEFVPAPGYEEYGDPINNLSEIKGETSNIFESKNNFEMSKWRYINGPFISVWVNNVPWASKDIMAAPRAKFSDGCLDLVVVGGDCPKSALLSLLLKLNDGSYVESPYVTYLKIKALRLEAGKYVGNSKKGGIIDMDGEVIARANNDNNNNNEDSKLMDYGSPFEMTVDKGLATFFTPN